MLNTPDAEISPELREALLNKAHLRKHYHQIRWIDENGMERMRVDTVNGQSSVVSEDRLQDKSSRYYFTEAMKMRPGELYFSRFDLNVERGRIELPIRPMLRIATPVVDTQGRSRGIAIINYSGKKLIKDFSDQFIGSGLQHAMLVDGEGYWLVSPDDRDAWNFMYDGQRSFAKDFAGPWQQIFARPAGQLMAEKGLFTFRQVLFDTMATDPLPIHRLYVITRVPPADIAALSIHARDKIWGSVVLLLMLGVMGVDRDGKCTFINQPALDCLGYREDELVSHSLHEKIHSRYPDGTDYPESACPVTQVIEQGITQRGEDFYIRKDGSFMPVELISKPVRNANRISGCVISFRDITEKIEARETIYHLTNYDRLTSLHESCTAAGKPG